jgi:hypothetical protein
VRIAATGEATPLASPAAVAGRDFGDVLRQAGAAAGAGAAPVAARGRSEELAVEGAPVRAPPGFPGLDPEPDRPGPGPGDCGRVAATVALARLGPGQTLEIGAPGGLAFVVATGPAGGGAVGEVEIQAHAPPALEAAARADLHAVAEGLRHGGGPRVRTGVNTWSATRAPSRQRLR